MNARVSETIALHVIHIASKSYCQLKVFVHACQVKMTGVNKNFKTSPHTEGTCLGTSSCVRQALRLFPLIAKPNSHARCENFPPITIFESTRKALAASLRLPFCDEWKRVFR